jgi:hypothetical protein
MIQTGKFRIAACAARWGRDVTSTICCTVKEHLSNRRGVFIPFTGIRNLGSDIKEFPYCRFLLGRVYLYENKLLWRALRFCTIGYFDILVYL